MKKSFIAALSLIAIVSLTIFSGCQQVPLTGRQQLLLVSDADALAIGKQQYDDTISKSKLSMDPAAKAMTLRVGTRLANAVDTFIKDNKLGSSVPAFNWEFNVIDDPKTVNAFCLPGGKIAVYTGILPVAKNDSGLAVVLAHEIAHAVAKHGAERLSQLLLANYGSVTLADAMKSEPKQTQDLLTLAYGVGANVGILLPYNRLQESEADHIGLILMARAGYDPREALSFWQRMEAIESGSTPEFLSTHPITSERIAAIQNELPEALKYYKPVKDTK
ncbi:MAG TPA: M48 family metallopeptidase [Candidatus Omnitrophota bacterium]|nr:M48 family metallopeptidase [Candidatus Omnitrophota bacterium]